MINLELSELAAQRLADVLDASMEQLNKDIVDVEYLNEPKLKRFAKQKLNIAQAVKSHIDIKLHQFRTQN